MVTEITLFGQLTEITGTQKVMVPNPVDTATLLAELGNRFPMLSKSPLIVAVNKRTITENTPLRPGDEVALMPPFSGG
jgi:molybdopterin converting factor small subunit